MGRFDRKTRLTFERIHVTRNIETTARTVLGERNECFFPKWHFQ